MHYDVMTINRSTPAMRSVSCVTAISRYLCIICRPQSLHSGGDKKWLFTYDPRCDTEIKDAIALRYTPHGIVSLYGEHEIAVCGLTSYLEPIVCAYDISGGLRSQNVYDSYVFSQNWKHKHCTPMMIFDRFTQLLYVAFRGCADLLALNTWNEYAGQAVYHAQDDTFMAFDMLPKHACKKSMKRRRNDLCPYTRTWQAKNRANERQIL
eukprot:3695_1